MHGRMIFAIIFCLLCSTTLYSNNIKIIEQPEGIKIEISSLVSKTKLFREDLNYYSTDFIGITQKSSSNSGYNIQEIRLVLAVPEEGILSANLLNSKISKLGLFDLAKKENSSEYSTFSSDLNNKNNLIPNIKIQRIGRQRGVTVALLTIQPFEYNPITKDLSVADSMTIFINFPEKIQFKSFIIPNIEKVFYSNIENQKYLQTQLKNQSLATEKNIIKNIPQKADGWYKPQKHYLRISTKRDGIAIIKAEDVFAFDDSFKNLNIDLLHLLYQGKDYPITFRGNRNMVFDEGDEIVFAGKRAQGDTTWFDNYTSEAVFYLTYEEIGKGLRIDSFQEAASTQDVISSVKVDRHLEYDSVCFHGGQVLQAITEQVRNEGYYWNILNPFLKIKDFTYLLPITPTGKDTDSLELTINLNSLDFVLNADSEKHKLKFIFNNDTIETKNIKESSADSFQVITPRNPLLAGFNDIKIITLGLIDIKTGKNYILDKVGMDYLRIKGNELPFAYKGKADFQIPKLPVDSKLTIPGFSTKDIILIDTINNFISFKTGKAGTSVRLGTISGNIPYTTIMFNDSSIVGSTKPGLHIVALQAPLFTKYEYKFFDTFDAQIVSYIESIPALSVVAVAYNSAMPLSADIRSKLSSLGSKEINNLSPGQPFVFAVSKGDINSAIESRKPGKAATMAGFFDNPAGKSYSVDFSLQKEIAYNLIAVDTNTIEIVSVENVTVSDLLNKNQQADVIIISHKDFLEAADSLARYRSRRENLNITVVDVDNIYKEFFYGRKSPHAIKDFLKYAYNNWQKPALSYLILIGDANWDARNIEAGSKNIDFIPSYGWPISDHWYSMLDGDDIISELMLGRIPVTTQEQAFSYIDKLIEYDSIPSQPWQKMFLFLSGGTDNTKRKNWFEARLDFCDYVLYPELCGDSSSVSKRDPMITGEAEGGIIVRKINDGAVWTNFLGHSSPEVFDMDGWQVWKFNNKGRYGFLTTISCNSSAFAEPSISCRNEDYMLEPNKGFIACAGGTHFGDEGLSKWLLLRMLRAVSDPNIAARTFGEINLWAKTGVFIDTLEILLIEQYVLLGDPLAKLKISTGKDLYFQNNLTIKNKAEENLLTEDDSLAIISGTIYNAGFCQHDNVKVLLIREYEGKTDSLWLEIPGVCLKKDFTYFLPILDMPGIHKITILIDPDNELSDPDITNNKIETTFEVFTRGLLALDPLPYWDIEPANPEFRVINPLDNQSDFKYSFEILNEKDTNQSPIYSSVSSEITNKETYISWMPKINLDEGKNYWIAARSLKLTGTQKSAILWIPFHVKKSDDKSLAYWNQSGKSHLSQCNLDELEIKEINNSFDILLKKKDIPYYLFNNDRNVEISYDNKVWINTQVQGSAPIGMNILVVSSIDGSIKNKKNFDTWNDDSSSVNFIRFLRDSVADDDYALIATCGPVLRIFYLTSKKNPTSIGSSDTLKSELRKFGSKEIDRFQTCLDCYNSFVMVGKRGAVPGTIDEMLDTIGVDVQIEGNIPVYSLKGEFSTPPMGPAKYWNNINITGEFPDSVSKFNISVYSLSNESATETELLSSNNQLSLPLNSIDAKKYPYIRLKAELERSNKDSEPYISSINSTFTPAPELAFVKSKSGPEIEPTMRGDTAILNFTVQNISPRINSEKTSFTASIYTDGANPKIYDTDISQILPDEFFTIPITVETAAIPILNYAKGNVNQDKNINEIYYTFNNITTFDFSIYEDTIKPIVVLKCDGKPVQSGDYVTMQPNVEVLLYDNSYLPVTLNSSIKVKINSVYQDDFNTTGYTFKPILNEHPLKASLTFLPDSLEYFDYEENLFTVEFVDASGNRDTVKYYLWVSYNGYIKDVFNYPNPFEDGTSFNFVYRSPEQGGTAKLRIYNLVGQIINTIEQPVSVGNNSIVWNGRDFGGNSLSSGVYFHSISVEGGLFVEPYVGRCLLVK